MRSMPRGGFRRVSRWVPIAIIVAVGVGLRAQYLHQWPIGFRPTLEFDSANAARTIFLWLTAGHSSGWQQAWLDAHPGRFIEPPIMQTLTALTYLPGGVERPWMAAVFAAAFWFIAAGFLFDTMRRLSGWCGATVATGFFLLAPFPEAASQSFQPEPLVTVGLTAVIWWASLGDVTVGRRFWLAVLVGSLAALTKPGVLLPFIAGAYAVSMVSIPRFPWHDRQRWVRLVALLAITTLPAFLYAFVLLPSQVADKVLPQLLVTPGFYAGWFNNVLRVVGLIPLVLAILGFALLPRVRILGIGLGGGYLVYSAVFTWHTMTHDYYQLPLVVVVAVGAGALCQYVFELARGRPLVSVGAALSLVVAAGGTFILAPPNLLGPTPGSYPLETAMAQLGHLLGPGERVLTYAPNYGKSLEYYGKLIVAEWPSPGDLAYFKALQRPELADETRLQQMMRDFHPHYFVIAFESRDLPRLMTLLDRRFKKIPSDTGALIYDLSQPIQSTVSDFRSGTS